jgi:hypothetical protein
MHMCCSEWADNVNSALEDGRCVLQDHLPPTAEATPSSGALQNAKHYLIQLDVTQRFRAASSALCEQNSADSRISTRFSNRLIINQSVNATIVQAHDTKTGQSVILKVQYGSWAATSSLYH